MSVAAQILKHFRGREDYIAVPNGKAFKPKKLPSPMRASWLNSHLEGERCLGFYLLTAASQCFCTCVDFDNKPASPDPEWQTKTEHVYFELVGYGLQPLIEISQSGSAAHVWLFFDEPVDAWLARQFWRAVSEKCGVEFVEIYPRQDRLSGKQLGNLVRYPLFNESRFVDVENEWATVDPGIAIDSVKPIDVLTLKTLFYEMTGKTPAEPLQGVSETGLPIRVDRLVGRSHTLLGRRWSGDMEGMKDKSKSALVQSIACELVRLYVPTPEVELALRQWCDVNAYDKGERDDWIAATVSKAYEFVGDRQTERLSTSWTMKDAVKQFIAGIGTEEPHIGSGIAEIDGSVEGVGIGEMAVLAARPSHGKTAFGLQWIDYAASLGLPCLLISEEMSRREIAKRALLSISKLDFGVWSDCKPELDAEVEQHFRKRAPVYGVEACQTIEQVEKVVAHHADLYGVRIVAVDYLQLLAGVQATRYEQVTDISRRLKQAAVRCNVAMLVMCQLNREIEKREKWLPKLSDLRESGQIEQDADLILFLQWPFRVDSKQDETSYWVYCAKRRNGAIVNPQMEIAFDAERQRFSTHTATTPRGRGLAGL